MRHRSKTPVQKNDLYNASVLQHVDKKLSKSSLPTCCAVSWPNFEFLVDVSHTEPCLCSPVVSPPLLCSRSRRFRALHTHKNRVQCALGACFFRQQNRRGWRSGRWPAPFQSWSCFLLSGGEKDVVGGHKSEPRQLVLGGAFARSVDVEELVQSTAGEVPETSVAPHVGPVVAG